ncbi:MAG: high frequency lysogenization protein HflD [Mariprofundus sp.]|nr:high frequency lysogenization protein HflD [Mariprofundus sp.]
MSSHTTALTQRAIALAALTQAVYLVDCIARKGVMDAEDCKVLMESMFTEFHANDHGISQLYGSASGLTTGLRICIGLLKGDNLPQAKSLMVYSGGLMTLERRLAKNAPMRHKLAENMQRITHQKQYFGDSMHNNVIAAIADLYGETISTMKPRIMVHGKAEYLNQPANTRRVRALLMSGLRAAHLWHKHGGGHLNLLLRRKALVHELKMLQHLP